MTIDKYKEIMAYLKEVIDGSVFAGHVFAVGGCERDKRLKHLIKDIDLVVDIPNGGIMFANWLYENNLTVWNPVVYEHFGTAMFTLKKFPDIELETVQTRKESYRDIESRNPDTAYGTIMEDCTRRDFTVNAFYYDISNNKELDLNGKSEQDLNDRIIRTCGDPEIIFNEDPLRILRMVRFATRLSFEIEENTFKCAKKYVDRLSIISRERIHDEFMKMCDETSYHIACDSFLLLWDLGAFKYIIPYFGEMSHKEKFNFINDLREYCADIPNNSKEGLFAKMLFEDPNAEQELRDLKCPNDFIDEVMFFINTNKKFFNEYFGEDEFADSTWLFRKYANICGSQERMQIMLSCGDELDKSYYFEKYDDYDSYLPCLFDELCSREDVKMFFTYKLPVDGNDVMAVLNIGPSKEVKEALDRLWMFAFVNPQHSDRSNLLNYLVQVIKNDK